MHRVRTSTHVQLLAIAFFTLLPRPTGYAEPGQATSTSTVTREQAAPFLGDWTIATSSPFGPATYHLSLTNTGAGVRGMVKTANQPDVVVTNIKFSRKSLVLTYRIRVRRHADTDHLDPDAHGQRTEGGFFDHGRPVRNVGQWHKGYRSRPRRSRQRQRAARPLRLLPNRRSRASPICSR